MDRKTLDDLYRGVGSSPYDPLALLKMVLYQNLKGRRSPATWFEEAKLNEAMQWLGRGYQPARRTWYDFRDRVGDVIEQLHERLLGIRPSRVITVRPGIVSITKAANISSVMAADQFWSTAINVRHRTAKVVLWPVGAARILRVGER